LTVDFPSRGLPESTFLIQTVSLRSLGNGIAQYTVKFGSFSFALDDFLVNLFNEGKKIQTREGEVVDDLVITGEAIPIVDAAPTFVESAPPFTWGAGGSNDTTWNFGQWD